MQMSLTSPTWVTRDADREAQQHISSVCSRCRQNGDDCIRAKSEIKFRHGSSARYDLGFSKSQTWLKVAVPRNLICIDETAEVAASYIAGGGTEDSDTEYNVDLYEGSTFVTNSNPQAHVRTSSLESRSGAISHDFTGTLSSPVRGAATKRLANPERPIPRSSDTFESQPPRYGPSGPNPLPAAGFPPYDDSQSLPALSPSLSWLSLRSPGQRPGRPASDQANGADIGQFGDTDWNSPAFTYSPTNHLYNRKTNFDLLDVKTTSAAAARADEAAESASAPAGEAFYSPPILTRPLLPSHDYLNEATTWTSSHLHEAVLMRFFIQNLAHWYDICDPERHFQLVVPQRARGCPPLLNAIFTASARVLTRVSTFRAVTTIDGCEREVVAYANNILPDLQAESAIRYHNESIKDLIRLSMDPEQVHNVDLLAAAIILRHHEEVHAQLPLGGKPDEPDDETMEDVVDNELFLKVTNLFLSAQQPAVTRLPHTSPAALHNISANDPFDTAMYTDTGPSTSGSVSKHHQSHSISSNDPVPRVPRADGLRQASFWVAFRMEILVAFLKQRSFHLPLSRCSAFRTFEPAEDAVWADRLVVFCADVLFFCYGGTDPETIERTTSLAGPGSASSTSTAARWNSSRQEERDRWDELQSLLQRFSATLPKSFEPIYFRAPDPQTEEDVFPEIWYLDAINVTGVQHMELARILLVSSNPHLPKLGPGHLAAMLKLSTDLKNIVLRLCGIALSNRHTPPGMVTASMAIAMCGEHFQERKEQEALMGVLWELERDHAWPTDGTRVTLSKAWGWQK